MRERIMGTRIYPGSDGYLEQAAINQPATFGRSTNPRVAAGRAGWWQVTTPDGCIGSLNPAIHSIVEHADGTITVTPSIDMSQKRPGGWHGWLTNGEFISC